jgi:hypothetical protein
MNIVCPECGKEYKLPDSFAGKKVKCKGCGVVLEIEVEDEPEEEVEEEPEPEEETAEELEQSEEEFGDDDNEDEEDYDADEAGEETEKASGGKGGKIVLIILCILFLGAAGAMGYLWFMGQQKAKDTEATHQEEVHKLKSDIDKVSADLKAEKEKYQSLVKEYYALKEQKILFYDGFDTSMIEDRWKFEKGKVTTKNKRLVLKSDKGVHAFSRTRFSGDVEISFAAKISPFKKDGTFSDISFFLAADTAEPIKYGYFFGFGSDNNTKTKVMKRGEQIFIKPGKIINPAKPYYFRIVVKDDSVKQYYKEGKGGEEKLIINLPNARMPKKVNFGIYTHGSELMVDDVKIVKIK